MARYSQSKKAEVALQHASRLQQAARKVISPAATRASSTPNRRDILGLIADFECLIRRLKYDMNEIDQELSQRSRQATAMAAYRTASRQIGTVMPRLER